MPVAGRSGYRSDDFAFGHHDRHGEIVRGDWQLLVQQISRCQADGKNPMTRQKPIKVAAPVPETVSASVEREAENKCDVDSLSDLRIDELVSTSRRLHQPERQRSKLARVGVDVKLAISRFGSRNEHGPPALEESVGQIPGIDLGTEREADEDSLGSFDLGKLEDGLGDASRYGTKPRGLDGLLVRPRDRAQSILRQRDRTAPARRFGSVIGELGRWFLHDRAISSVRSCHEDDGRPSTWQCGQCRR